MMKRLYTVLLLAGTLQITALEPQDTITINTPDGKVAMNMQMAKQFGTIKDLLDLEGTQEAQPKTFSFQTITKNQFRTLIRFINARDELFSHTINVQKAREILGSEEDILGAIHAADLLGMEEKIIRHLVAAFVYKKFRGYCIKI